MRFTDIRLDESELALIEQRIREYDEKVYGGTMGAHQKSTLRAKLTREYKEGVWDNRDYLEADEGEPPKGAIW